MDRLGPTALRRKKHDCAAKQPTVLEDLGNHPPAQLAELRLLLTANTPLRPDPQRRGLFEVDGRSHVFYICKYPSGTKITLIAVWERKQASEDVNAEKAEEGEQIVCC